MSSTWICNSCGLNNPFERNTCQACFIKYPDHDLQKEQIKTNINMINTGWIKLQPAPKRWLSKPIMLNKSEFIVATEKLERSNNNAHEGIFSYHTFRNKWSMYFEYPDNIDLYIEYPTIFMDKHNNTLYLHSSKGTLLIINTTTMTFNIKRQFGHYGGYARIFSFDNKFHLIGGHHNKTHFIWNNVKNETNNCSKTHVFDEYLHGIFNPAFIHIKSQHMLLLFGGYDSRRSYASDTKPYKVYCYKYKYDKQWKQFKNMTMPYNISLFGFALSCDEKYVVISGGQKLETDISQRDIFIMDIENGKIYKSKIDCPELSTWHSVIMPRNMIDEILVNGYLRKINIPQDLCDIILLWYSCQCLYLLKDNGHWKINLNYLLKED
eukprot:176901_1